MSIITRFSCLILLSVGVFAGEQQEIDLTDDDFVRAEIDAEKIEQETQTGLVDPTGSEDPNDRQFFEGDMKGFDHIDEQDTDPDPEKFSNGIGDTRKRWPGGQVPYSISSSYSSHERATIAAAVKEFNDRASCVQWLPRTSQSDYVFIFKDGGCYSSVGKMGGRQFLSLDNGCVTKGIAMHEMMHASGFYHEQSRNDRDNYITIVRDNMIPGKEGQFTRYGLNQITHLNTAYDYGSIMHYGRYAFSRNGRATIEPKQSGVTVGQRSRLSSIDVLKLQRMYGCDGGGGTATTTRPIAVTTRRPTTGGGDCEDESIFCHHLRDICRSSMAYPREYCKKTCDYCDSTVPTQSCTDDPSYEWFCRDLARQGYCDAGLATASFMKRNCCGTCRENSLSGPIGPDFVITIVENEETSSYKRAKV